MRVYVDSSVILRIVLGQAGAFVEPREWELAVCSELLRVEVLRSLDRLRLRRPGTDAYVADKLDAFHRMAASFHYVPIRSAILTRAASPFPTALDALDAIHLATALLWIEEKGEPLTLLTHDAELALAARACGLQVKTAP
jgi:predicted nucleic acid-binding protein